MIGGYARVRAPSAFGLVLAVSWVPSCVCALLVLAFVPSSLEASASVRAIPPMLVLHRWAAAGHGLAAGGVALLAGFTLDILTYGPLGFWALIYVAAVALADRSRSIVPRGMLEQSFVVFGHLFLLAMLQAGLTFICTLQQFQIAPLLWQVLLAALLYPVGIVLVKIGIIPTKSAMSAVVLPRKTWR